MKKSVRYKTTHIIEDQYEPGSSDRVLRNLLHISRKCEMDIIEAERYTLIQTKLMDMFSKDIAAKMKNKIE